MDDLTYIQQRKENANDSQTETWLYENGITKQQFSDLDIGLLQAQKVATNLLQHHARLLGQNQAHTLNNYLHAMRNGVKRKKLTQTQAFKILNIGTEVNRKLFKQYRQLKQTNNSR
jgi:hypothetical protein